METLSGPNSLPDPRLYEAYVTWGVFDGVHIGHQKVLRRLREWAGEHPSLVITFDRHPAEVLSGKEIPLVIPLDERLRRMEEAAIRYCLVLEFTRAFAETSAEQFVRDTVADRIRAKGILLGHDSHFGKDRRGDFAFLSRLGTELKLEVRSCEPEVVNGRPVSSTAIREAIAEGRVETARDYLGRPFSVSGVVSRGDGRGRILGYPTANLRLPKGVRPPRGVYAVDAVVGGLLYRGAANLGTRPTFYPGETAEWLEVFLLDYAGGALYDRPMEVRFLARLRDEAAFESADELKRQIEADIAEVRGKDF